MNFCQIHLSLIRSDKTSHFRHTFSLQKRPARENCTRYSPKVRESTGCPRRTLKPSPLVSHHHRHHPPWSQGALISHRVSRHHSLKPSQAEIFTLTQFLLSIQWCISMYTFLFACTRGKQTRWAYICPTSIKIVFVPEDRNILFKELLKHHRSLFHTKIVREPFRKILIIQSNGPLSLFHASSCSIRMVNLLSVMYILECAASLFSSRCWSYNFLYFSRNDGSEWDQTFSVYFVQM